MEERIKYLEKNFYNLSLEEKKYLNIVIKSIVDTGKKMTNIEKRLLTKYAITEKCNYYGYPIVIVDFDESIENESGFYSSKLNKIIITKSTLDDNTNNAYAYPFYAKTTTMIDRLLLVCFHECEHYFQHCDSNNGIVNERSYYWMLYSILRHYDNDEYKRNYNYKQIENQANINGWHDVGTFYARLGSKISSGAFMATLQSTARQNLANQKDKKSMAIEDYNISKLIEICYKHPSVIEKFPILKKFFKDKFCGNKYGLPVEIETLINNYNCINRHHKSTSELQSIYMEFLTYYFSNDISIINTNCDMIVLDLISNELFSLSYIFDVKDTNSTVKNRIVEIKINRIMNFYEAIEKLDLLDNKDEPLGTIREILNDRARETLKVYETAKLMYGNDDDSLEIQINKLREKFLIKNIEYRDIDGRESALNI